MKFGIIGTGRIAKRFIKELEHVEGASVPCVYNPHEGSAVRFVGELQDEVAKNVPNAVNGLSRFAVPKPLSKIDEMWNMVDAVYIASPHGTHFVYTIEALEHGKHVLCEKPMALKMEEAKRAFSLAKEKGLILMEGLKTAYMPGFRKVIEVAKSGVIGDIAYINATFTKLVSEESREFTDKAVAGAFLELGSYGMLAVFSLLGTEYEDVSFDSIRNKNDVDIFTVADFKFENTIARVETGIGVKSEGSLVISGTKGYILVPAPWWLTRHFEVHFEDPNKIINYDEKLEGDGLRYEVINFIKRVEESTVDVDINNVSIEMASVFEKHLNQGEGNV